LHTELDDIRAAFEHHIAFYGHVLHADRVDPEEARPDPGADAAADHPVNAPVVVPVDIPAEIPVKIPVDIVAKTATEPVAEPAPKPVSAPGAAAPAELRPASRPQPQPAPSSSGNAPSNKPTMYERITALIPPDSPLHGMKTLKEVEDYVANTHLIDLDKTRLNPVFGVGNPNADLLVIGEAPGADEDKKGEPFVGRAGQLLTQILEAIGFNRPDVYIANILKSRPPNNRDPLPEEIRAHMPILQKQIELIKPKVILCVGRTSGTSLLGTPSALKDMRSIFHDYHGIPVLVTYHPAALLRNPNWKRPTWEDVQLLRRKYDELTA
jgi:uracil-DNA glycosylase family 4